MLRHRAARVEEQAQGEYRSCDHHALIASEPGDHDAGDQHGPRGRARDAVLGQAEVVLDRLDRGRGGRAEVTVGYTAAAWFNVMTTSSWIQGVQEAAFSSNRDNLRDTLTFDGLFARFLFRF